MKQIKHKKIKIAIGTVVVLFCLWLIHSTFIISFFYNKAVRFERTNIDISSIQYLTYFGFDEVGFSNDIYNSINIRGWVYCDSEASDSETQAKILWMSDAVVYEITPLFKKRYDIYELFNRKKLNSGILASFSPLQMKDGEYRLCLSVEEKKELAGFVFTDYYLIKKGGKIELQTFTSTLLEDVNIKSSDDNLRYHVAISKKTDETLTISGWLIPNEGVAGKQKIVVEVIDELNNSNIYTTQVIHRPDIAEGFDNDEYAFAGFSAIISNIESEIYQIRLLCENMDGEYVATDFEIVGN